MVEHRLSKEGAVKVIAYQERTIKDRTREDTRVQRPRMEGVDEGLQAIAVD